MQIEEEFRDIKSSLFGLDFEHQKAGMGSVLQCSSSSSPLAIFWLTLMAWPYYWLVCSVVIK
jgi:hypothetical protein